MIYTFSWNEASILCVLQNVKKKKLNGCIMVVRCDSGQSFVTSVVAVMLHCMTSADRDEYSLLKA